MEGLFYLLLLPVAANLVLGGAVLRRNVRDRAHQILFVLCVSIAAWGVATILYLELVSLLFARLSFATGMLAVAAFFLFTLAYPEPHPLSRRWLRAVYAFTAFFVVVSLTPLVLKSHPQVAFGPLIFGYVGLVGVLLGLAIYLLVERYRRAHGSEQVRVLYILVAALVGILWATAFNLVIPVVVRGTPYNWVGAFGPSITIAGMVYVVFRNRLFNLQLQAQRLLNVALPMSVAAALAVASGFILRRFALSFNPLAATVLLVSAIGLYEALRRVFKKTWVGHALSPRTFRFHDRLIRLAAIVSGFSDLDDLAGALKGTFTGSGVSGFGLFVVTEPTKRAWIPHEATTLNFTHLAVFSDPDLHAELFDYLVATAGPLVVDEVPYRRPTVTANLQAALKELSGAICLPLLVGRDLVGVAVLGTLANRRAYTSEDVEVLREVSVPCAVALAKARLLADYQIRTEQLERDKRNLEASIVELRRIKSSFLDIVDHQFNTPLSVIKSAVAMIREGDVPLGEVKQFLDTTAPRIEEFDQIIQGMLTAAHLDGTRAELKFAPLDVNSVIGSVLEELKPLAAERHVAVGFDAAPELPRTLSDPDLFKDALRQLIKNALIYGQDGTVGVKTQKQDGHLAIIIRDAGRGFDADEADHIGEKFYRGLHVADYLANGSGLGVFIAKRVIEASGGQLTWHSDGPGKGAAFTAAMPPANVYVTQKVGL